MGRDYQLEGPIVVGGLGGSGTRTIAESLQNVGVYMGRPLNRSYDNLVFTFLIKRPYWLPPRLIANRPSAAILDALRLLERLTFGDSLSREEMGILSAAAADMATWGHNHRGSWSGSGTAFRLAAEILESASPETNFWGWKEPNSHLVLPELIEAFPDLTYVHVIRHPLDMAFSSNMTQVILWGSTFGIEIPEGDDGAWAEAQLRWWLVSTELAVETGRQLGDRFVLLSFEDFCTQPAEMLKSVCRNAAMDVPHGRVAKAVEHVQTPSNVGRWRNCDWTVLDSSLVEAARGYGFELPNYPP